VALEISCPNQRHPTNQHLKVDHHFDIHGRFDRYTFAITLNVLRAMRHMMLFGVALQVNSRRLERKDFAF
jgi:hypothetical protein